MAASLAIRVDDANPNHHLWNNHGTWWIHYTLRADGRRRRVRTSLATPNLEEARELRDRIFETIRRREPQLSA